LKYIIRLGQKINTTKKIGNMNDKLIEIASIEHDINYFLMLLYEMTVSLGKRRDDDFTIVELGVRSGSSTLAFLAALEKLEKGKLWSCDIDPLMEELNRKVVEGGLYDYWYFWQGDSVAFGDSYFSRRQVDIVFVDTSHEFDQTVKEIEKWSPKVKEGGKMIFHDTCSRHGGVSVPIKLFLEKHGDEWSYYNIDVTTGLGVMTKTKAAARPTVYMNPYSSLKDLAYKYNVDKINGHENYMDFYEEYLFDDRMRVKNILEIGVLDGNSLRMWREYFPNATIHGIEYNDCKYLENEIENCKIYVGDQADIEFLKTFVEKADCLFDVIIDDGSHQMSHQIDSMKFLFNHVKNGGFYFVEDVETSYHYMAKNRNNKTFMKYAKSLIDVVNCNDKTMDFEPLKESQVIKGLPRIDFRENLCVFFKGADK